MIRFETIGKGHYPDTVLAYNGDAVCAIIVSYMPDRWSVKFPSDDAFEKFAAHLLSIDEAKMMVIKRFDPPPEARVRVRNR